MSQPPDLVDIKVLDDDPPGGAAVQGDLALSSVTLTEGGAVKFLQWDSRKWAVITDWIASDQSLVRPMIEASAAQYAKEKGITPRDCSKVE